MSEDRPCGLLLWGMSHTSWHISASIRAGNLTVVRRNTQFRFLKPGFRDIGYVAHPSFVEATELNDIKGPLPITAAGDCYYSLHSQM